MFIILVVTNYWSSENSKLPEKVLQLLLCYVKNIYPKGVRICNTLSPIEGLNGEVDSKVLNELNIYRQAEEKHTAIKNEWTQEQFAIKHSTLNQYFNRDIKQLDENSGRYFIQGKHKE